MRMSQSMVFSQSPELRPVIREEIRLTQANRQVIRMAHMIFTETRLQLLQALYGESFQPQGRCPYCSYKLKPVDILRGFNSDPLDFTTECPRCGERFEPKLIATGPGSRIEMPFWCASQVIFHLRDKKLGYEKPEEIARREPAVYRSALVHFGSLRNAFKAAGQKYRYREVSDWKAKIRPFLGKMPDRVIAEAVGAAVSTIGQMRRRAGVKSYTARRAAKRAARFR